MLVSVTEGTMTKPGDLVQGTLDLLILRVVALEPVHGWAIARRIRQISGGVWQVGQSALHPALHKLEQQGCITAGGKISENKDRKSTRLNSSHSQNSDAVFCLKKKQSTYRSLPRAARALVASR